MEKRNEEIFIREEDGGSQKHGAGRSPSDCVPQRTEPMSVNFPSVSAALRIVPGMGSVLRANILNE